MQENADIFKKLNNHRLPIDESYWAEMEERLQNDHKKVVPLWVWFAGTGIAASLALLLTVQIFNVDDNGIGTQITQIAADEDFLERTQITRISADNITNENTDKKNPRQSASSAFQKNTSSTPPEIEESNISQTKQDATPEIRYELKPKYDDVLIAQNEPKKTKLQRKKQWLIAAAFSSGTSNFNNSSTFSENKQFYNGGDNLPDNGNNKGSDNVIYPSDDLNNPSMADETSNSFQILPTENDNTNKIPSLDEIFQTFSEVTHLPPLSFGLTVRRNFNKYFAIETGLTYSFLQSKFKENNEWQHRDATLKLHYIGIPLNAVAYLINKPRWNVYFSLGGMVEKGIVMNYVQHTTYNQNYYLYYGDNQPVYNVSLQDNISGLQWSFNTAFGIGYKFYRDFSIYFEPRLLYYFKNNQPVSVRTEMPLLVGLNSGLRFEF